MNKLIGLKNLNSLGSVDSLKKELLLFDKILIVGLKEWKEVIENNAITSTRELLQKKGLQSLNDFVIYQGYISMYEQIESLGGWDNYYEKTKTEEREFFNQNLEYLIKEGRIIYDYNELNSKEQFTQIHKEMTPIIERKLSKLSPDNFKEFANLCNLCHDLKTRILSTSYDSDKFTVIPCGTSIYDIENITNIKADVYNLLLEDFPIVDTDQISWEQIFDFKNDPNTYNSIWSLRNWVSSISKTNKEPNEIEEEYRDLKYQYEQVIKLHKMKTSNSIFQTTIQTSAELIENIAKLNFKKVTDIFFKFKANNVSLMEIELKSKGNQLSYLYKAKSMFNK